MTYESDEVETVRGFPYTHWDCPNCGEVNQTEDEAKGEILECIECG